jgi:hypothetical protein
MRSSTNQLSTDIKDWAFLDVGAELAGFTQQLARRGRDVGIALDDGGRGRIDRNHAGQEDEVAGAAPGRVLRQGLGYGHRAS